MARLWLLVLLAAHAACRPERVFVCETDEACTGADGPGRCEASRFCSFVDDTCASGWRYGERAGDDLGGECTGGGVEPDAGPDRVVNGGFEAGLGGWEVYQAELSISEAARSGEQAALVCGLAGQDTYTIGDIPNSVREAAVGEVFEARAWVRAAPDGPTPVMTIVLREPPVDADIETRSTGLAIDDTWRELVVEHTTETTNGLGTLVHAAAAEEGTCFLVDDVSIRRR